MVNKVQRIYMITTGGTIEKTYDERDGSLGNRESIVRGLLLDKLRLPYLQVDLVPLLSKDSLYMDDSDRATIAAKIAELADDACPIVVLHGTDTMHVSTEHCLKHSSLLKAAVVFTGAMRPVGFQDSDALQNVTEAIVAAQLLPAGVYISFHSQIFQAGKVRKNRSLGTFEAT